MHAASGDMFAAVQGRRFGLLVANPPYVPSCGPAPAPHSPARAWSAGADGRALLDRFCASVGSHLAPGGAVALVDSTLVAASWSDVEPPGPSV